VMQLSESPRDIHDADRTRVETVEQPRASRPVATPLKKRRNHGGSVFFIIFKTGHALPLLSQGFCVRGTAAASTRNIRVK
jgi:hypothetical protein